MLARLVSTSDGDGARVQVLGEIDISNAAEIRTGLIAILDQHQRIVLDLGSCRYFDSSGVALVHELRTHARAARKTVVLEAPEGSYAHRVLVLSGLMGSADSP